jgi:hypothetical protein
MAGGIRYRKRIAIIRKHLYLNISRSQTKGWTFSWTVKAFGVSHNLNRKKTTVDLPGGLYYEGKGRKRAPGRQGPGTPARRDYSPAKWPFIVLGVLLVLGVIGGAVWQSLLLFGLIAVVVVLVQRGRAQRAGTPAQRDAVTPAPEPVGPDPAEAERIVRDWTPPADWDRKTS